MVKTDTLTIGITGMSCGHCLATVKEGLSALPGVSKVEVTLAPGRAVLVGKDIDPAVVLQTVEDLGYTAVVES